jgi:hypothetical protein
MITPEQISNINALHNNSSQQVNYILTNNLLFSEVLQLLNEKKINVKFPALIQLTDDILENRSIINSIDLIKIIRQLKQLSIQYDLDENFVWYYLGKGYALLNDKLLAHFYLNKIKQDSVYYNKSRMILNRIKSTPTERDYSTLQKLQYQFQRQILGLTYQKVNGDGHCLYHAVGLYLNRTQEELRQLVADYIENNRNQFADFVDLSNGQTLDDYLYDIRSGKAWADHIEIEVLMRIFQCPIIVIQKDGSIRNLQDAQRYPAAELPIFVYYNGHIHYDAFLLTGILSARAILNRLISDPLARLTLDLQTLPTYSQKSSATTPTLSTSAPEKTKAPLSLEKKYDALMQGYSGLFRKQVQTEKHFFRPQRTFSLQTKKLAATFQENRFTKVPATIPNIDVGKIPTRRLITAEVSVLEASLETNGRNKTNYTYVDQKWNRIKSEISSKEEYSNHEIVSLNGAEIKYQHRLKPHRNHLGDYFMYDLGTYKEIYNHLFSIVINDNPQIQTSNEILMAEWMLRYIHDGQPVTLEELSQINSTKIQADLDKLNRILYHCFVKEISSRMLPGDASRDLPLATAQARALKLIAKGMLKLKDVFDQDAPFGVYTGINIMKGENFELLKQKLQRIECKYLTLLHQNTSSNNLDENQLVQLTQTRADLHHDLLTFFGGDVDSDGEGYDSETAEKEYPSTFEFNKYNRF